MIVQKSNVLNLIMSGHSELLIMWLGSLISADNSPNNWEDNETNLRIFKEVLDENLVLPMTQEQRQWYYDICNKGIEIIERERGMLNDSSTIYP